MHAAVGATNATVTTLKDTIDDTPVTLNFTIATKADSTPELTRASDGKTGYYATGDDTHVYYHDAKKLLVSIH